MTRTTLLLISPPALYDPRLWGPILPAKPHLYSLAGFVRDVADVRIVDLDVEMGEPASLERIDAYIERIDEHISLTGVDLVGISCWTSFQYLGAVEVARVFRNRARNLPIVVGGHHPTAVPSDFTGDDDLFDFVVRGDGEHALRALCEELPARPPKPRVVDGAPFEMPSPDAIDWATYPWHDEDRRMMWLNLSRGCPFECEFCVGRSRRSAYSVDDTLNLLERLETDRSPKRILLSDPLFGADRKWAVSLLEGIEKRGFNTKFWAETRADLLTPELLDRLHTNDFWVDFGLDTGSVEMVLNMCKSRSAERYLSSARTILRHADAIGIPHLMYLLFNFPGETPETMQETMDFVEELVGESGQVTGMVAGQTFFILPGTGAYDRLAENESRHGTEIRYPGWWRERGNQYQMATDVLPSAAFAGRESDLQRWSTWQRDLNATWASRRPKAVNRLFRQTFG